METDKMKKCAQCGHEKPIEDFSKSYKNLCKACVAENVRNKRAEKPHYEDGYVSLANPTMHGMITASCDSPQFIPNPRFIASVAAMQGLLANTTWMSNLVKGFIAEYPDPKDAEQALIREVVTSSVQMSDALIYELKTKKDENND